MVKRWCLQPCNYVHCSFLTFNLLSLFSSRVQQFSGSAVCQRELCVLLQVYVTSLKGLFPGWMPGVCCGELRTRSATWQTPRCALPCAHRALQPRRERRQRPPSLTTPALTASAAPQTHGSGSSSTSPKEKCWHRQQPLFP